MEKIKIMAEILIKEIEKKFDSKVEKIEIEQSETSIIMAIKNEEKE